MIARLIGFLSYELDQGWESDIFFHGSGSGSTGKENPDPTPDPTLNRNKEKNIYIF